MFDSKLTNTQKPRGIQTRIPRHLVTIKIASFLVRIPRGLSCRLAGAQVATPHDEIWSKNGWVVNSHENNGIDYAEKKMHALIKEAKKIIAPYLKSNDSNLIKLIDFVVTRTK